MLYKCGSCQCFCSTTLSSLCRMLTQGTKMETNKIESKQRSHSVTSNKYTRYESYLCVYKLNSLIYKLDSNEFYISM